MTSGNQRTNNAKNRTDGVDTVQTGRVETHHYQEAIRITFSAVKIMRIILCSLQVIIMSLVLQGICYGQDTLWSGTTIFGVMTKHEILIGADSRGTPNYASGPSDEMCKVFSPTGNLVFAITGIARVGNLFDLATTVAEGCRRGKSYEAAIKTCDESLRRFLKFFDNIIRPRCPQFLDTLVNKSFFEVIYCSSSEQYLRSEVYIYEIARDQTGYDSIVTERYSFNTRHWKENTIEYIIAGYDEKIKSYLDHNPKVATKADNKEFVENMIRLEFSPVHPRVGGHIDVVRISPSGISWITPRRNCLQVE